MIFRWLGTQISKVSQAFVLFEISPSGNHAKMISDGQEHESQKFLKILFCLKNSRSGNHAKMIVRWPGQTNNSDVFVVFEKKLT